MSNVKTRPTTKDGIHHDEGQSGRRSGGTAQVPLTGGVRRDLWRRADDLDWLNLRNLWLTCLPSCNLRLSVARKNSL